MSPMRSLCLPALMLVAFVGCDSSSSTTAPAPSDSQKLPPYPGPGAKGPLKPEDAKPAEKKADAAPAKPLDVAGTKLSDGEIAEISKIESEADRKIALEQKLCPVSGEHLGSMDKPVKVMVKDQAVFVCCGGCKKDVETKPAEALAKLGK